MAKTFVLKFGGASIKDATAIMNLHDILFNRLRNHTVIVISAMGKTTNQLEEILELKLKDENFSNNSAILKNNHLEVCHALFPLGHRIFSVVENYFAQLNRVLEKPLSKENYDPYYDAVISYGELIATSIVHEYLCERGLFCIWQDARTILQTNEDFRFAKVDWEATEANCKRLLLPNLEKFPVVTQGFIAATKAGRTTTLGREGSDFSAAILGFCLNASSVTIWKDVEGVLNSDPKKFPATVKFDELDYQEAVELTYYGASVIHPKTIKPLANKQIPLYVKSFLNPEGSGTKIHQTQHINTTPCIVQKEGQVLISFKVTDFTFIQESHTHLVYRELDHLKLRVNLMQLSAISISLVIDRDVFKLEKLLDALKQEFEIRYNEVLDLITIKNHHPQIIRELTEGKEILLEQMTRATFQVLIKPSVE